MNIRLRQRGRAARMLRLRGYATLVINLSIVLTPPRLNVVTCHMEYSEPHYKQAEPNLRITSTDRSDKE